MEKIYLFRLSPLKMAEISIAYQISFNRYNDIFVVADKDAPFIESYCYRHHVPYEKL